MNTKNIVIVVLILVIIGAVVVLFLNQDDTTVVNEPNLQEEPMPVEPDGGIGDGAEPLEVMEGEREESTQLGTSVSGQEIVAYHFGNGETEILLVGGVHGGYSPNTTSLTEDAVSYFEANSTAVPENIMVTIIPALNPDGLEKLGTAGRFNANNVDLNRNFDCEWSAEGVWQNQEVSGGSEAFSEPEAAALRDYVEKYDPDYAIVWFSAEGKVYPSACAGAPSAESVELAETFASAAGYPTEAEFDAYSITGDMVNWMAKQGIPAISVLLSDHESSEWTKNKAGIEAVINAYAE